MDIQELYVQASLHFTTPNGARELLRILGICIADFTFKMLGKVISGEFESFRELIVDYGDQTNSYRIDRLNFAARIYKGKVDGYEYNARRVVGEIFDQDWFRGRLVDESEIWLFDRPFSTLSKLKQIAQKGE